MRNECFWIRPRCACDIYGATFKFGSPNCPNVVDFQIFEMQIPTKLRIFVDVLKSEIALDWHESLSKRFKLIGQAPCRYQFNAIERNWSSKSPHINDWFDFSRIYVTSLIFHCVVQCVVKGRNAAQRIVQRSQMRACRELKNISTVRSSDVDLHSDGPRVHYPYIKYILDTLRICVYFVTEFHF